MISLFYFLAGLFVQFAKYDDFSNFYSFAIFCAVISFATDYHFKPGLGVLHGGIG
jgi:hypothetical protein